MQLFDLEFRVKENLGGQLEVSYLNLRDFTRKNVEAARMVGDIFLSVWEKGNGRFLSFLGKHCENSC